MNGMIICPPAEWPIKTISSSRPRRSPDSQSIIILINHLAPQTVLNPIDDTVIILDPGYSVSRRAFSGSTILRSENNPGTNTNFIIKPSKPPWGHLNSKIKVPSTSLARRATGTIYLYYTCIEKSTQVFFLQTREDRPQIIPKRGWKRSVYGFPLPTYSRKEGFEVPPIGVEAVSVRGLTRALFLAMVSHVSSFLQKSACLSGLPSGRDVQNTTKRASFLQCEHLRPGVVTDLIVNGSAISPCLGDGHCLATCFILVGILIVWCSIHISQRSRSYRQSQF